MICLDKEFLDAGKYKFNQKINRSKRERKRIRERERE